jgi:hypothetical protein
LANEELFRVRGKHAASAGKPPHVNANTEGRYHGYFENEYGEQAVFVYDSATKEGKLWHGDAGWERSHKVISGLTLDLVLSREEEMWLQACWDVATALERNMSGD